MIKRRNNIDTHRLDFLDRPPTIEEPLVINAKRAYETKIYLDSNGYPVNYDEYVIHGLGEATVFLSESDKKSGGPSH